MRVAAFSIVLVGKVICCVNLCDKRFSKNLLTPVGYACVSRVRLKLSVRTQFLFLYSVITLRNTSIYSLLNLKCFRDSRYYQV